MSNEDTTPKPLELSRMTESYGTELEVPRYVCSVSRCNDLAMIVVDGWRVCSEHQNAADDTPRKPKSKRLSPLEEDEAMIDAVLNMPKADARTKLLDLLQKRNEAQAVAPVAEVPTTEVDHALDGNQASPADLCTPESAGQSNAKEKIGFWFKSLALNNRMYRVMSTDDSGAFVAVESVLRKSRVCAASTLANDPFATPYEVITEWVNELPPSQRSRVTFVMRENGGHLYVDGVVSSWATDKWWTSPNHDNYAGVDNALADLEQKLSLPPPIPASDENESRLLYEQVVERFAENSQVTWRTGPNGWLYPCVDGVEVPGTGWRKDYGDYTRNVQNIVIAKIQDALAQSPKAVSTPSRTEQIEAFVAKHACLKIDRRSGVIDTMKGVLLNGEFIPKTDWNPLCDHAPHRDRTTDQIIARIEAALAKLPTDCKQCGRTFRFSEEAEAGVCAVCVERNGLKIDPPTEARSVCGGTLTHSGRGDGQGDLVPGCTGCGAYTHDGVAYGGPCQRPITSAERPAVGSVHLWAVARADMEAHPEARWHAEKGVHGCSIIGGVLHVLRLGFWLVVDEDPAAFKWVCLPDEPTPTARQQASDERLVTSSAKPSQ